MSVHSVASWILGLCAVLGNMVVLIWRCRNLKHQKRSVIFIMILHLALFDLMSGAYLVIYESLSATSVFNTYNSTFSYTANAFGKACFFTNILFVASVYCSEWITFSIAVYSVGTLTSWRRSVTRFIAGSAFLITWIIFVASIVVQNCILDGSTLSNTATAVICSKAGHQSIANLKYLFVFQCVSFGLMTIGSALYFLAFIPRIQQWKNMQKGSEARSLVSLHARLLSVVFVNALTYLLTIGLSIKCALSVFGDKSIDAEECRETLFAAQTAVTVPAAINPILYTLGTFQFLKVFLRLRSCLPYCKCNKNVQTAEQQSLLGERDVCCICCVRCCCNYNIGDGHDNSYLTEDVQSSKLFTESGQDRIDDASPLGLSSLAE